MRKYKRTMSIVLSVAIVLGLAGCGNQKDDNIAEDLQNLESVTMENGEKQSIQSEGLAAKLNIPQEQVTYDIFVQGSMGSYQINANVDVPEESMAAIYEMKKRQVTAEEFKKMAENLFDGGDYAAIKPYVAYTMEELLQEEDTLKTQLTESVEENGEGQQIQDHLKKRLYDIYVMKQYEDQYKPSNWSEGDFTDGVSFSAYSKILVLEGKISDVVYDLMCYEVNGLYYVQLLRQDAGFSWLYPRRSNVVLASGTLDEISVDPYLSIDASSINNEIMMSETNDGLYGKNACILSQEESETLAKSYMEKLGVNDMEVACVNSKAGPYIDLIASSWDFAQLEEDESLPDRTISYQEGYVIYLEPSYHGMQQMMMENEGFYAMGITSIMHTYARSRNITTDEGANYTMQNLYRVEVDSEGVLSIEMMWDYEMGEELSGSPELMQFEQIDKIAQDYMTEQCNGKKDDSEIDSIALRYLTLLYDGNYVLMPVWVYSSVSYADNNREIRSYDVLVNAVDGSIIKTQKMLEGDLY